MMTTQMHSHVIGFPDTPAGKISRGKIFRSIRRVLSPARWICASLLGAVLACSAFAQEAARDPIEQGRLDSANDPAEPINRGGFKANKVFDDFVLKPVARAYVEGVSPEVRQGIHNFTNNVGEPVVFANDVLQGNVD